VPGTGAGAAALGGAARSLSAQGSGELAAWGPAWLGTGPRASGATCAQLHTIKTKLRTSCLKGRQVIEFRSSVGDSKSPTPFLAASNVREPKHSKRFIRKNRVTFLIKKHGNEVISKTLAFRVRASL
jgi:hypothetical protein